ncbi:TetR/AcrR family transcriptional regulator [Streptomyces silvensis]|uniref:TetR family transcriptional regulator n=1 Tax=Streptomyces silvensis TaxID=1765722 RepID=A0A0W7WYL8_9ACTN|nr:TetR/AcrR family transcriptional regulator [Streptomyces silvensis]KUF15659.1 TetR family transcriptional regulator [Streptomyces silvensis]
MPARRPASADESSVRAPGLRERKKQQTASRIWHAAVDLFVERGYDKVSVAEIAAAADVSKMTVFNYFGTKDDVLLAPMEEHVSDAADAIRARASGESAADALRRRLLDLIEARDPSVGLGDSPRTLQVLRLITETPVLLHRAHAFHHRSQQLLATALAEETGDAVLAEVAAAQLIGVRNAVFAEVHRRRMAGTPLDEVAATADALARDAFDLVEKGLSGYAVKA